MSILSIKIEVKDQEFDLTLEEAETLYNDLAKLFSKEITTYPYIPPLVGDKITIPPTNPTIPWYITTCTDIPLRTPFSTTTAFNSGENNG